MKSRRWLMTAGAAIPAALLIAAPARAQGGGQPQANASETSGLDIIVTAQKREADVQDVPMSVSAVTSDMLERANVTTLESLQRLTPGMSMSSIGSGFVSYTYIRGAGTNVIDSGSDPSVAFFVDEVYIAGTAGLQFDLLDVARVEVLKGPQGTLFGRNAAGGAISIITKRPTRDFEAWATADAGNYGLFAARGGVSGPIGAGDWSYRLSVAHRQRDAFTENPVGRDPGDIDTWTGRGQLMYDSERFTLLLTGEYFTSDNGMTNQFINTANTSGVLTPAAAAALPADQGFYRRSYDVDGFERQDTYAFTGRFELDLGGAMLTSISAYRDNRFKRLQDQDGTLADAYALGTDQHDQTFSQELRLSGESDRFQWIAGLYFYDGKTRRVDVLDVGPAFASPAAQNTVGTYRNRIKTTSYAAFGQATYEIVPDLRLTLGARYSRDEKDSLQNTDPIGPLGLYTVRLQPAWESFDPAAILEYKVNGGILLYGSYRKGYKSGGFQSLPGSAALASNVYAPEKVESFEIGAKTEWFGNRLRVNLALFDTRIDDQQILRIPAPGLSIIDNAGKTRTYGADLSVQALLGDHFRIDWNTTLQHARFDEYLSNCSGAPSICLIDYKGNRQLRSPDFQTAIAAEARIPLADAGEFKLSAEYSYQSRIFFDAANTDALNAFQPGYGLLNGRIGYGPDAGNWNISVFVKNLTKEKYWRNVALSGPTGIGTPGDPRTFGLTLSWRSR